MAIQCAEAQANPVSSFCQDLVGVIECLLFEFARSLQRFGPAPLFQYIVTTTTEPPKEFLDEEWRRLTIRGAPASEQLLLVDL